MAINNKNSRNLFLLVFLLLTITSVWSQQIQSPAFYQNNWQLLNPALIDRWQFWYNGHQTHHFSGAFRGQWNNKLREEAPKFGFVSYEYAPQDEDFSVGVTGLLDQANAIKTVGGTLKFNYGVSGGPNSKPWWLSGGIRAGYFSYGVDINKLNPEDASDPVILNATSMGYTDVALGAVFRKTFSIKDGYRKSGYLGLSIPQAIVLEVQNGGAQRRIVPHFIALTGFIHDAGHKTFFEHSLILRAAKNTRYQNLVLDSKFPISADFNSRICLKDKFWLGVGYATTRKYLAEIGFEYSNVRPEDENNFRRNGRVNKSYKIRVNGAYVFSSTIFGNTFELSSSISFY